MFRLLWLYIVVFAVGPAVREILPTLCALCLIPYYRYNWQASTLRRCTMKPLFACFFLAVVLGTLFSQDVWASFLHVGRGINKAFVLPFVAMECVQNEKDLRRLIWAAVLACLWQGCNGIWQSVSGFDFIDRTPILSDRLTGSLSDYRVGNYAALMLIPAAGVWFILRERFSRLPALCLLSLLLGPALYLVYFTYTRNAWFTLIVAAALYLWIWKRIPRKIIFLLIAAALAVLALLVPQRLGPEVMAGDGRWGLWRFALAVFQEFPLTGAGFGQYNAAFRELGLVPSKDLITISHPHNIYLQLFCEAGIVGFVPACVFLFGILFRGYRHIRTPLAVELRAGDGTRIHCRLTALLWCAWGAYLASGLFGHDFFRIWWQAVVMTHLGIMIGAVTNMPESGPDRALES